MLQTYSYKFRLNPNKEQQVLLNKHFGCVRLIYNYFLNQRIEKYKEENITLDYYDNQEQLPILKKTEFPWLKEINSQSLQYAIKRLQNAYDNFFENVKNNIAGKKGFPRFKKKSSHQSFQVPQNIKIENKKLIIPKFLEGIEIIQHREIVGTIRNATISRNKVKEYYVSITVKRDISTLPKNNNSIGIDLNVSDNVDSNGKKTLNPLPHQTKAKRLKFLHQELSRKAKGSENRNKAKVKLAKLYSKCHNKREDHNHKLSKQIIDENQIIICESLNIASMLKKANTDDREIPRWKEKQLHKNIQDCGWYSLITKLKYKAEYYGRKFIQISQWFPSSQLCSNYGWRYKELKLDEREWFCFGCFKLNDRDYNSAKNILNEGLRLLNLKTDEITNEIPGTGRLACCPDIRRNSVTHLVGQEAATL